MSEHNERMKNMKQIFEEIKAERERQDQKWGIQRHHPFLWNTILAEEFGEINKATLDFFNGEESFEDIEMELIQTAAVCVSYLQSIRADKEELLKHALKDSSTYAANIAKSKYGVKNVHIMKIENFIFHMIRMKEKEYDIRKMNKDHIKVNDHIVFEDLKTGRPLGIVLVTAKEKHCADTLKGSKIIKGDGYSLIQKLMNKRIIQEDRTEDFFLNNYMEEKNVLSFKIELIQDIEQL